MNFSLSLSVSFLSSLIHSASLIIFLILRFVCSWHNHLTIRLTDKSNNFYIGLTSEFKKKEQAYFNETNAYIQLNTNPFDEVLNKVIQLLNQLRSKKFILKWQYDQMMPDVKKIELAHLYFNPKTHKVCETTKS